ncbi:phosphate ABC transporter permease PstA [Mumia zhuanghuii]|uniref:Phosphate transport system permease protein PstA n=1 Tax=Mumia zhuanghuii TaxID=2585211 RepID=A0A5Q6S1G2_9ACTN|nr:phosphate ABC transporter permease PstA [Mumia zhuanghuii]
MALAGAVLASLATTWLLYTQVLPLSGRLGFIIVWYAVFIAYFAGLTALTRPWPIVADRIATILVVAAPVIVGAALASAVLSTVIEGFEPLMHANFYVDDMSGVQGDDAFDKGGLLHAIAGTVIQMSIAVAIAMPLGLLTAIFTAEVGGKMANTVRSVIEAMTAMPSVVAGLFIYTVWLVYLGQQTSGFAASLALAIMALPIMARASDVVLRVVPGGLREASYALGATRWQTVWHVVLPTARPALATALILGVARAVGETSPLLLTSGASTYFNANPFSEPMNSLPLYIYSSASSGIPQMAERANAAAAVLLVVVLTLFTTARLIARRKGARG